MLNLCRSCTSDENSPQSVFSDMKQPCPPQPRLVGRVSKRKDLSAMKKRHKTLSLISCGSSKESGNNAKFGLRVLMAVMQELCVTHHTIKRVWKHALQNYENPAVPQLHACPCKIKTSCTCKRKWNGMMCMRQKWKSHFIDNALFKNLLLL
jgi:hypothetical protein